MRGRSEVVGYPIETLRLLPARKDGSVKFDVALPLSALHKQIRCVPVKRCDLTGSDRGLAGLGKRLIKSAAPRQRPDLVSADNVVCRRATSIKRANKASKGCRLAVV